MRLPVGFLASGVSIGNLLGCPVYGAMSALAAVTSALAGVAGESVVLPHAASSNALASTAVPRSVRERSIAMCFLQLLVGHAWSRSIDGCRTCAVSEGARCRACGLAAPTTPGGRPRPVWPRQ